MPGRAVILLEDYRLRRTATILGADLGIRTMRCCWLLRAPTRLSAAHYFSATNFAGVSVVIRRRDQTAREQAQVDSFFESLANRLTVFVHDQVETVDLQLVRRVVEREKPAHVAVTYMRASQPFLIGMASLLGVNTYLTPTPAREIARADQSAIGRHAFIAHLPGLDPRLEGVGVPAFASPIARIAGPRAVPVDTPISLDAGGSSASPGHLVTRFHWTIASGPS